MPIAPRIQITYPVTGQNYQVSSGAGAILVPVFVNNPSQVLLTDVTSAGHLSLVHAYLLNFMPKTATMSGLFVLP